MQWIRQLKGRMAWRQSRASAWGAFLGQQEILVAALSVQQTGGVRVMVFEHLHAPAGLVHLQERDAWLVQSLTALGAHLPQRLRTMAIAVSADRCRQGVLAWEGALNPRHLAAEVQLEAAAAWGVAPDAVAFDFRVQQGQEAQEEVLHQTPQAGQAAPGQGMQVEWAACLREELLQWQGHARSAGWRLPLVETELQAVQRAVMCLRGDAQTHWAQSPQDWQFARLAQRELGAVDWLQLQSAPMWKPMVACGAALGALQ